MKKHILFLAFACVFGISCTKIKPVKQDDRDPFIGTFPPHEEGSPPASGTTINNNGIISTALNRSVAYRSFITVDVDANGQNDFYLGSVMIMQNGIGHTYILASPVSKNGGMIQLNYTDELPRNAMWAAPLDQGTAIAEQPFKDGIWNGYMVKGTILDIADKGIPMKSMGGPWVNAGDKYMGIKIIIDGKVHFGWLRFSHTAFDQRILFTGYAYNASPGEPIMAGSLTK